MPKKLEWLQLVTLKFSSSGKLTIQIISKMCIISKMFPLILKTWLVPVNAWKENIGCQNLMFFFSRKVFTNFKKNVNWILFRGKNRGTRKTCYVRSTKNMIVKTIQSSDYTKGKFVSTISRILTLGRWGDFPTEKKRSCNEFIY